MPPEEPVTRPDAPDLVSFWACCCWPDNVEFSGVGEGPAVAGFSFAATTKTEKPGVVDV